MDNLLPVSGDILRADEAIKMIPNVNLGPPIEVPEIPPEANENNISDEERQWLNSEIDRFVIERDALLLAHNYTPKDTQKKAKFVGDSLYLAKIGRESKARVLMEASVLFMNEILAVRKRP